MGWLKDKYCNSSFHVFTSIHSSICDEGRNNESKITNDETASMMRSRADDVDEVIEDEREVNANPHNHKQPIHLMSMKVSSSNTNTARHHHRHINNDNVNDEHQKVRMQQVTPPANVAASTIPSVSANVTPSMPSIDATASAPTTVASTPTTLIVGLVVAGAVAVLLVAAFVVRKRAATKRNASIDRDFAFQEDGLFVPDVMGDAGLFGKGSDMAQAPRSLFTNNALPSLTPLAAAKRDSWPSGLNGNSNNLIFAQSSTDMRGLEGMPSDESVFGSPLFVNPLKMVDAERAVVIRRKQSTASPNFVDRHSMEWPDEMLEDPLEGIILPGEDDGVCEFPDVPAIHPNDPRLQ